jgi:hypothetical protein
MLPFWSKIQAEVSVVIYSICIVDNDEYIYNLYWLK